LIRRERIIKGDSLVFDSGLIIKHPTVEEIMDIGFDNYMNFANLFILKPQDLIIPLWGEGIYYEDITKDELFSMKLYKNKNYYIQLFLLLTNCDNAWIEYIEDLEIYTICYNIKGNNYYIGFEGIDLIYKYFKCITMYTHSEKRYFSGEKTRKRILDEDFEEYEEYAKSNSEDNNFSDMISFVVISNKRDWDKVYSYPMARFYEEYIKTHKKQEADCVLSGIYGGTIDSTKIKTKKLQWFKS